MAPAQSHSPFQQPLQNQHPAHDHFEQPNQLEKINELAEERSIVPRHSTASKPNSIINPNSLANSQDDLQQNYLNLLDEFIQFQKSTSARLADLTAKFEATIDANIRMTAIETTLKSVVDSNNKLRQENTKLKKDLQRLPTTTMPLEHNLKGSEEARQEKMIRYTRFPYDDSISAS